MCLLRSAAGVVEICPDASASAVCIIVGRGTKPSASHFGRQQRRGWLEARLPGWSAVADRRRRTATDWSGDRQRNRPFSAVGCADDPQTIEC
jgi:hypothetical protein